MNCNQALQSINDYVDGYLIDPQRSALSIHLATCESCKTHYEVCKALKTRLKSLTPTPQPDPQLVFKILDAQRAKLKFRSNITWFSAGMGTAVAASLAVWLVFGLISTTPQKLIVSSIYEIDRLNTPQTINVLFHSKTALENVRFSVTTPQSVDIEGYSGQNTIVWHWRIKKGENLLKLPVIARNAISSDLVMALEHNNNKRVFKVTVDASGLSQAPS